MMDDTSIVTPSLWIVTGVSIVYLIYRCGSREFDYFNKQGIPGPKPVPYVGNSWGIWKENLPNYDRKLVKKYGRVLGVFDGTQPNLFTTDAEMIKTVFVKEFDHFINRRDFRITAKVVRKMVGLIRFQEWKDLRSSITPIFTTGKIKRVSVTIEECAQRLVGDLDKLAKAQGKFDGKQMFNIFTMDVIGRCAFGMQLNTLGQENDPFMTKAQEIFRPPLSKSAFNLIPILFPSLIRLYGEKMFHTGSFKYFIDLAEELVQNRANSSESYHDLVDVLTETVKKSTKEVDGQQVPMWTKEDVDEIVIAQSVMFLLVGTDTTATTLANAVFLLARNPEVQEKLYDDIVNKCQSFDRIGHEMMADFPYVDHVLHEVMRMYPPTPRVERSCNKDFVYNNIRIEKGVLVTVPVTALHHDPEYYPEPHRFNPDRWSPDSPIKPNPYAYLPFGMGPRNCVGLRFAMEEMKIALCTVVKNFRFFPVEETPEEMQFEDGVFTTIQPVNSTVGIETR